MPPLSLVHRVRAPQDGAAPPPLLLLLHGVGSHEEDLLGLAPYLDPRFLIVSARGPVTLAPGMYAWFQVVLDPANPVINPEQAESSRRAIIRFIDEAFAEMLKSGETRRLSERYGEAIVDAAVTGSLTAPPASPWPRAPR